MGLHPADEDQNHRIIQHVKTILDLYKLVPQNSAKGSLETGVLKETKIEDSPDIDHASFTDIVSSYTFQDDAGERFTAANERPWLRLSSTSSKIACHKSSTSSRLTSPFDESAACEVAAESTSQDISVRTNSIPTTLYRSLTPPGATSASNAHPSEEGTEAPTEPKSWLQNRIKTLAILGALVQLSIILVTISIVLSIQNKQKGHPTTGALIFGVLGLAGLLCALLSAYDLLPRKTPVAHTESEAGKESNEKVEEENQGAQRADIRVLDCYRLADNGYWQLSDEHCGHCNASANARVRAGRVLSVIVDLEAGLPRVHPKNHEAPGITSKIDKTQIRLLKSYIVGDSGDWQEITRAPAQTLVVVTDQHGLLKKSSDPNLASKAFRSDKPWISAFERQNCRLAMDNSSLNAHQVPQHADSGPYWPLVAAGEICKSAKGLPARMSSNDGSSVPETCSEGDEYDGDDRTASRILSLYSTVVANEYLHQDLMRELESRTPLMPFVAGIPGAVSADWTQKQQTKPLALQRCRLIPRAISGISAGELARRGESDERVRSWQEYLLGPGVDVSMQAPPPSIAAEPQSPVRNGKLQTNILKASTGMRQKNLMLKTSEVGNKGAGF